MLNIHAGWVDKLTQVSCHILDLVITRDVNELININHSYCRLSLLWPLSSDLWFEKTSFIVKEIAFW